MEITTRSYPELPSLPYFELMTYLMNLVRQYLDRESRFLQICVHMTLTKKAVFSTPFGLFEYQVMPFGLKNATNVFQRLMQKVLAGVNPEKKA